MDGQTLPQQKDEKPKHRKRNIGLFFLTLLLCLPTPSYFLSKGGLISRVFPDNFIVQDVRGAELAGFFVAAIYALLAILIFTIIYNYIIISILDKMKSPVDVSKYPFVYLTIAYALIILSYLPASFSN